MRARSEWAHDTTRELTGRGTALEFDPDRFLDERLNKYFVANPFIFLPFNAGPRICLGQQVRRGRRAHAAFPPAEARS